ncbi:two-component hybrid sensor and regulator [Candidatus Vecturithrix granuli]|uniref:Two-component hybrid sensor and regulator n=1 Tax=Vecturithrix granuli TaxID=1499967 RepID=A0A081C0U1_VECG1|nr:two-component hybrid sensor and regulator [Candidatus Vecturithrix granuli]
MYQCHLTLSASHQGLAQWVFREKQPYVVEESSSEERADPDLFTSSEVQSYAVIPLLTEKDAIGVIVVEYHLPQQTFSKERLNSLVAVANTTALAIENSLLYRNLEERVRERTRQLEIANQRLKELDQLKSDFLSTVSHELRTPLTSVLGFVCWILRKLLRHELEQAGYQILEAQNGYEALTIAREQRPDVIILDVMMPGMDGFEVTTHLKQRQETADIPILMISIVENEAKGYQIGVDHYLTKPIDSECLLTAVSKFVAVPDYPLKEASIPKTILLIEDDDDTIRTITRVLEERAYKVVHAQNGQDGIQLVRQASPNLIIMLTAKGQNIDKVKAKSVDADEYMTKPFNPDLLLEKACDILGIEL